MDVRELEIPGSWVFTPRLHGDPRGVFAEWFTSPSFEGAVGHPLDPAQANLSVSAAGVVRGLHLAKTPPGQAKYVTCVKGAVLDVVVDLRVGSETFGRWTSVLLDDVDRRVVYLSEGLGHGFCSLEDGSTVVYLCSTGYDPSNEVGVHPLDPELGITWPTTARDGSPLQVQLSAKDEAAPGLSAAVEQGLLSHTDDVAAFLAARRQG